MHVTHKTSKVFCDLLSGTPRNCPSSVGLILSQKEAWAIGANWLTVAVAILVCPLGERHHQSTWMSRGGLWTRGKM